MSVRENKTLMEKIFSELAAGNHRALLSRVAEDARWEVTGTSPVSGTFFSRKDFYEKVLSRITSRLVDKVRPKVVRILGEKDWVVVEWRGESLSRSGHPYNNSYCWVLRLEGGEIQEGIIYTDTELVTALLSSP